MIRAIFWDNDGVLVETEGLYFQATARLLAEHGLTLTKEAYRRHFLVEASGVRGLLPTASESDVESLRARRNTLYAQLLTTESIAVEGAAEVLTALGARTHMGVVTSSLREHFQIIHDRTGFHRHFQFVLALGDYAECKPHPAPYLAALELVRARGIAPHECLVVEDSLRGLRAAKAAGLRTWVIPSSLAAEGDFVLADRVLTRLTDVVDAFDGID